MKPTTFSHWSSRLTAASLTLSVIMGQQTQEIGFIEDFALAADRDKALDSLIPGTEDYYYFHALHYQTSGQREKYRATLGQWEKRFPRSDRRRQITRRQILIDYDRDPQASLEALRRELGLEFNHQQEGRAQAREHPSRLDPAEVSWERFLADALEGTGTLEQLEEAAFFPLMASGRELTAEQRRELLSRVRMPDLPGLFEAIVADLGSKESRGFGEFPVHHQLTLAQLEQLRGLKPELLRNNSYVERCLAKMQPGAHTNPAADPALRLAFLERAWDFVGDLEPSFNSLKAHLLYQRLVHDRAQGTLDEDRFLEYVKLPRNVPYVRPEWRRDEEVWRHVANCGDHFDSTTGLPPIGDDEPLVREFLLHFLEDADGYQRYSPYLEESWLKAVFAEAKIVHGAGDPEQWASLLSPSAFQALKERVDLEFDPAANPDRVGEDEPVRLRVHVKNVRTLIVKVFEINTLNYYLEHGCELSTDINLDGLVPNHERTLEYDEPPARRVARDFDFPEIEPRRGVWVVEFIGGGKSSRAVIRRGKLDALVRIGAAGEQVTVIDDARRPVPGAAVWFGSRRFACDDEGRAWVPFSTEPGALMAVVEGPSGFASLVRTYHHSEDYQLTAGIHVDREALRSRGLATILVRPTFTLCGHPAPLERLEDVRLVLTSTDLDGVSTTATIDDFALAPDREATHEFRVPDRLAKLEVRLRAKVKVASRGGERVEVSDGTTFSVNDSLRSEQVHDLYLSRIGEGFVLELLGRSGETRRGQNLNLELVRSGFRNTRSVTLRTDAAGGVELGPLEGIDRITAKAPDGVERSWQLPKARRTRLHPVHAVAGRPVRIPYLGTLARSEVALFGETPGGFATDEFDKLKLEDGFLVARDLGPGVYRLLLKQSGESVGIWLLAGEQRAGHVFNDSRVLELVERDPAHLAGVGVVDGALRIRVANADPLTRVHVVATRFVPDFDLFQAVGIAPGRGLSNFSPARLPNLYLSGRRIGDEFRYILERRHGDALPGNMLERPEILLNPWAVRDTDAGAEELRKGEDFGRLAPGSAGGQRGGDRAVRRQPADDPAGSPRTVEFLAEAPAELLNLQPDENGELSIELEALGDRQHVHVMVVDPIGASYEHLSLPDRETRVRDLRLVNALDPQRHYTEQDSVSILKQGDKLEIPDILTSRFEVFDSLDAAYRYLLALRDDANLREFGFVVGWAGLEPARKRELYSEHACHELSFFLAMKDPGFFREVVRPHLANKRDRTFLDDYLLGAELGRYFEPFEYARLNVPERILLARRHPGRVEGIRRDLGDRIALLPPDLARDAFLFEGALSSFGLNAGRGLALDEARAKLSAERLREAAAEDAPAPAAAIPRLSREPQRLKRAALSLADLDDDDEGMTLEDALAERERLEKLGALRETLGARFRKQAPAELGDGALEMGGVAELEALYRAVETTKEWAENHYHHLPIERHTYELITENKFWLDFARHQGEGGFGSRHLGEASRSFHESMLALAVLDLPFSAAGHETAIDGSRLTFEADAPAIAFHREIREAEMAGERPPLLVSQSYFRHDDRFRIENGEKVDKFVTEEFVAGVVYGGQVVVTNPTRSRQKLDVLVQVPKGAIPVLGHRATATHRIALEPYSTQHFELCFYFPAAGDFPCYPAHVSRAGEVVAQAEPFEFKVVDTATIVDESSWAYLSQWGSEEQVLAYLAEGNLHAVELSRIAWRCRESAEFMKQALAELDRRGVYEPTLFGYGIHHDHAPAVRQFLLMQREFLDSCGLFLESPLVTLDPVERRAYQHLEYKPLVNHRAHRVGDRRRILNPTIRTQYQRLLTILSQKAALDDGDQLSTVYYLFVQDRAEEAIERLGMVRPGELPARMQYDYFQAYASFYRAEPAAARRIAERYAGYPVDRWRERFAAVVAQVDEIEGKAPVVSDEESREQQQEKLAAGEATLALEVEGSEVDLSYRNLGEVQVNYYLMDLEFLFSTNPFVSSDSSGFSIVRPNRSERIQLPADGRDHRFPLPREFQARNVLVEVVGEGRKRTKAVFANELNIALSENFGILGVRHAADDRPLPKVYVKVYAMTGNGPVFYKDGYTDLRGKFDYATVSTTDIADASKFSILVMSEDHGATVLEAPVPKR